MSVPRFFAPAASDAAGLVSLPSDEAHHLARVLRLGIGARVRVFDGRGREWDGTVASAGKSSAAIEIAAEIAPAAEPPVRVTLAVGLLKGDQMDAVVRDATALGASRIVPMSSAHVAVADKVWKSGAAVERWQRVAIASVKQCGRAVVPEIAAVQDFDTVLTTEAAAATLMCVEPVLATHGLELGRIGATRPASALVLIGPEGGWSAAEVDHARRRGATLVHLGPRTLRAQTVPTVVLSALWTVWGW